MKTSPAAMARSLSCAQAAAIVIVRKAARCRGWLLLLWVVAATPSQQQLHRAFARGDLAFVKKLVAVKQGFEIAADSTQRTPIHYLLEGRKHTVVTQPGETQTLRGEHEKCIEVLARAFPAGLGIMCPLVDAVHHRNTVAVAIIVEYASSRVLAECLEEKNIDGDTVLHVASDSMASGFGRHFIQQHRAGRAPAHEHGGRGAQGGLKASDLMRLGPAPVNTTLPALNEAVGEWDLAYLLEKAALKASFTVSHASWLETRNFNGEPYKAIFG
jgi:hypothetical protein